MRVTARVRGRWLATHIWSVSCPCHRDRPCGSTSRSGRAHSDRSGSSHAGNARTPDYRAVCLRSSRSLVAPAGGRPWTFPPGEQHRGSDHPSAPIRCRVERGLPRWHGVQVAPSARSVQLCRSTHRRGRTQGTCAGIFPRDARLGTVSANRRRSLQAGRSDRARNCLLDPSFLRGRRPRPAAVEHDPRAAIGLDANVDNHANGPHCSPGRVIARSVTRSRSPAHFRRPCQRRSFIRVVRAAIGPPPVRVGSALAAWGARGSSNCGRATLRATAVT